MTTAAEAALAEIDAGLRWVVDYADADRPRRKLVEW